MAKLKATNWYGLESFFPEAVSGKNNISRRVFSLKGASHGSHAGVFPGQGLLKAQPILEQVGPGSGWTEAFHAQAHPFNQLSWAEPVYCFAIYIFHVF